jgi:hypothetical protein
MGREGRQPPSCYFSRTEEFHHVRAEAKVTAYEHRSAGSGTLGGHPVLGPSGLKRSVLPLFEPITFPSALMESPSVHNGVVTDVDDELHVAASVDVSPHGGLLRWLGGQQWAPPEGPVWGSGFLSPVRPRTGARQVSDSRRVRGIFLSCAHSLRYCTNVAIHIEPRNPANRSSVQPRSSTKRCHRAPSNVAASTSRHSSSLMASWPVAAAARA